MPIIRIADTESNGFSDEATKVHCISAIDYDQDESDVCLFRPGSVDDGLSYLHDCDVLVMHNAIKHDLPLLKRLYNWEPLSHQIIIDTLVFSRMLYPKRPKPDGYTGKATHSIEAWGYRVGRGKPDHNDWTEFSEAMGVRCKEDSVINRLVLWELERESEEQEMFYHRAKRGRNKT